MYQNVLKTCLSTGEADINKFMKIGYHAAFSTLFSAEGETQLEIYKDGVWI